MQARSCGFTLIELTVVILVAALLTTIAVPFFNSVITNTRMSGEVNTVLSALNFARSEASKRGQRVQVCPGSTTTCAAGTDWTAGWQVLQPDNHTQLQLSQALGRGDTLTSSVNSYPEFTPMGYTFFNGVLSLHDRSNNPSFSRCIVFSAGSWTAQQGAACP